jgi:methionine sulfoxide reductase heme-binding subunit
VVKLPQVFTGKQPAEVVSPSRPALKRKRYAWLQILVHVAAWVPLAVLVLDYFNNNLTVNPIQAATQRTGHIAITLLILSLACTPFFTVFRFAPVINLRRPLGLYGYMYAFVHLLIFTGADYGFDAQLIFDTIAEKPYVLLGLSSFIILTLLALTSYRWWKARLGKNWKRLHRFVYLVNLLVVLHFGLAVKGDLLRLQGDIARPVMAGVVVLILLAMRLPYVRKGFASARVSYRKIQPVSLAGDSMNRPEIKQRGSPGD